MEKYQHGGDVFTHKNVELDMSININPLGMPWQVREAITNNISYYETYPDPVSRELRDELATYKGIDPQWIVMGNGASELISKLVWGTKPDCVLICEPTFSEYERSAHQVGAEVMYYNMVHADGSIFVGDDILDMLTSRLDLVFICNPNNPDGSVISYELGVKIIKKCHALGCNVLIDECFGELSGVRSYVPLLATYPNLSILGAFTKSFAMPGLRLGYSMCANSQTIAAMNEAGQSWSVSGVAQVAGIASLHTGDYLEHSRDYIKAERQWMAERLEKLGLNVFPGVTNFILVQSKKDLYKELLGRGILIRDCSNYPFLKKGYYRMAVSTHAHNLRTCDTIEKILHG